MPEKLVITPGGYRPQSKVHRIERGHVLEQSDGHLRAVDAKTGKLIKDFGPVRSAPDEVLPSPDTDTWKAWAYCFWGGLAITQLKTTWTVPPPPKTDSGQTVFLFNGIENSTHVVQ